MTKWIVIPVLLLMAVVWFTKRANRQVRDRQGRSFKTHYYQKKKERRQNNDD